VSKDSMAHGERESRKANWSKDRCYMGKHTYNKGFDKGPRGPHRPRPGAPSDKTITHRKERRVILRGECA
jgi:hypothetical protein